MLQQQGKYLEAYNYLKFNLIKFNKSFPLEKEF